jgi:hypothetical protein
VGSLGLLVNTVLEVVLYELVSTRIAAHHVKTTLLANRVLFSIDVILLLEFYCCSAWKGAT